MRRTRTALVYEESRDEGNARDSVVIRFRHTTPQGMEASDLAVAVVDTSVCMGVVAL